MQHKQSSQGPLTLILRYYDLVAYVLFRRTSDSYPICLSPTCTLRIKVVFHVVAKGCAYFVTIVSKNIVQNVTLPRGLFALTIVIAVTVNVADVLGDFECINCMLLCAN